jgi:hypothetical protein
MFSMRRVKVGQMARFFWKWVFQVPEIAHVSQNMRLDGDSCLQGLTNSPFTALNEGAVYLRNALFSDSDAVCVNLQTFVQDYVTFFHIVPKNKRAWEYAFHYGSVSGYYNNLEVMDIGFWLRPEVQHFVHFVDASHGIYLHRWRMHHSGSSLLHCSQHQNKL